MTNTIGDLPHMLISIEAGTTQYIVELQGTLISEDELNGELITVDELNGELTND